MMTNKLVRRVRFFSGVSTIITNIFVIIVAGLLGVAIIRNNYSKEPEPHPAKAPLAVGDKLAISDFDWTRTERTVVLALNKGCHYCEESATFYKTLIKETAKYKDIRIVALLPQDTETGRKYLNGLDEQQKDWQDDCRSPAGYQLAGFALDSLQQCDRPSSSLQFDRG